MGRGLTILLAVILLLALAGYVMYSYTPKFSILLIVLAVLLATLLILAMTGMIPVI